MSDRTDQLIEDAERAILIHEGVLALKAERDMLQRERDHLRDALRDLALGKPASECETFRPDLSGAHEYLNLLRDFARRALDAGVCDCGVMCQDAGGNRCRYETAK